MSYKEESALENSPISKILGLPNVWSSDLPWENKFLNSQTLGRSWDTLGRSRDAPEALLGTPGALLGHCWALLGAPLGLSWDALFLGALETRRIGHSV